MSQEAVDEHNTGTTSPTRRGPTNSLQSRQSKNRRKKIKPQHIELKTSALAT